MIGVNKILLGYYETCSGYWVTTPPKGWKYNFKKYEKNIMRDTNDGHNSSDNSTIFILATL